MSVQRYALLTQYWWGDANGNETPQSKSTCFFAQGTSSQPHVNTSRLPSACNLFHWPEVFWFFLVDFFISYFSAMDNQVSAVWWLFSQWVTVTLLTNVWMCCFSSFCPLVLSWFQSQFPVPGPSLGPGPASLPGSGVLLWTVKLVTVTHTAAKASS